MVAARPTPRSVLMITGEVARLGEVDSETVRYWERTGKLPAIKTPTGRRLFRQEDVEKFLAQRHAGKEKASA